MNTLDLRDEMLEEDSEKLGSIYDDWQIEEIVKKLQDVDLQAKILANQAEDMRAVLTQKMIDADLDKVETSVAHLTRTQRATWKYTDSIKAMTDAVKNAKKEEEETGRAEKGYTDYITIKYK